MITSVTITSSAEQRRAETLAANAARRAKRRLPTRHALACRVLMRAHLLPALATSGLTADEHRKLRNALKAMRKRHAR